MAQSSGHAVADDRVADRPTDDHTGPSRPQPLRGAVQTRGSGADRGGVEPRRRRYCCSGSLGDTIGLGDTIRLDDTIRLGDTAAPLVRDTLGRQQQVHDQA